MGEASGVFEPHTDPIQQLPLHEDAVRAFEACANKISSQTKRDKPSLWMGKYTTTSIQRCDWGPHDATAL